MDWKLQTIEDNAAKIMDNEQLIAELKKQIKAIQKENKELSSEIEGCKNLLILERGK